MNYAYSFYDCYLQRIGQKRVCKKFFCRTLDISDKTIASAIKMFDVESGILIGDTRTSPFRAK